MTDRPPEPRQRRRLLKTPGGWRPSRKSGKLLYDSVLPAVFVALGLLTLGLVLFALGILLRIIPYR